MAVIDSFNQVVEIARAIGDPSLKKALIEVRAEIKELLEENRQLRERNRTLSAQLNEKGDQGPPKKSVKFERGAYWLVDADQVLRGPMCRRCWETKQELHRTVQQVQYFFTCPQCGDVARLPGVRAT